MDKSLTAHSSPCRGIEGVLHARRNAKGGSNCREDGNYDVEDLAPGGVVVECSHSVVRGPTLTLPLWRGRGSRDAYARRGDKVGFC